MADEVTERPVPAVTFTERPDVLITAECGGLTTSWLRGEDDEAAEEKQKQMAASRLVAAVLERDGEPPVEGR